MTLQEKVEMFGMSRRPRSVAKLVRAGHPSRQPTQRDDDEDFYDKPLPLNQ